MKTKNSKKHPTSVHVRVERFFRHRSFLALVLSFMAVGVMKYESHMLGVLHELYYGEGLSMFSVYAHHEEVTRMPVDYGSSVRYTPNSGE
ncbi:MAG TPA: hypothetical protein VFT16_01095 [Candidatus Saccharimonadales bacterium]|nr:hypothetical protein [Candidatus Saccharimonadales bacterium]